METARQHKARPTPLARLDSAFAARRSLEISPSRVSTYSNSSQSRVHTPSNSAPNTPLIPTRPPSPEKKAPHPGESNTFLTALAAQDRRVLELREELQKAEVDLDRLKKQWAAHEAIKKRNELRHLEQLQPLTTSFPGTNTISEEDSTRASKELDRRKLVSSNTRPSQRKVFSGSRHTRALSLLSPKDSTSPSHHRVRDSAPSATLRGIADHIEVPSTVAELNTAESTVKIKSEIYKGSDKDLILETGKQLVGDFRQGLWTFFEDLKQVTVGDEASSTQDPRKLQNVQGSGSKKQVARDKGVIGREGPVGNGDPAIYPHERPVQEHNDADRAAGRIHELPVSTIKSALASSNPSRLKLTNADFSGSDDEDWDNWETLTAKASDPERTSTTLISDPMASPLTEKSSPKTSMSSSDATSRPSNINTSAQNRDDLPWPALTNLSPGKLTRTASTLMGEWEKSLKSATHVRAGSPAEANPLSKDKKME